jgi:hypothetical protein
MMSVSKLNVAAAVSIENATVNKAISLRVNRFDELFFALLILFINVIKKNLEQKMTCVQTAQFIQKAMRKIEKK